MKERITNDRCIVAKWPEGIKNFDKKLLTEFEVCKELVTQVRGIRQQKQISPKEKLEVFEKSEAQHSTFDEVVVKLANLNSFTYTKEKVDGAFSFMILSTEFFVPLAKNINPEEEKIRLKKALEYEKGFLKSVQVKLANEKFVANAKPELIAFERKKENDTLNKINAIEEQLKGL